MLMSQSSAKEQLEVLLDFIVMLIKREIRLNRKLMRDILDPLEGYLGNVLNKKGNYSHAHMKSNCRYVSRAVLRLKAQRRKDLVLNTHREHAIPLSLLIKS